MRLLFIILLFSITAKAEVVPVIILAGQSNMEGRGNVNDLTSPYTSQPTNYIYYNNPLCCTNTSFQTIDAYRTTMSLNAGMEYSLAYSYSTYKSQPVYLIKTAQGATTLANSGDWRNGGTLRNQLYSNINAALSALVSAGKTPQIISFVWYQGETDAINNVSTSAYETALNELIADFRSQSFNSYFITTNVNIQVCRISNNWVDQTPSATPDLIRAAQLNVATTATNVTLVNTDDATDNGGTDDIHKNMAGEVLIGNRVYNNIKDITSTSGGTNPPSAILKTGRKAIVM
jgi:hypothetical protein